MSDSIFDDLPPYDEASSKRAEMRQMARETVDELLSRQSTDEWTETSAAVVQSLFRLAMMVGVVLGVGATTLFGAELYDHYAGAVKDQFGRTVTAWHWSFAGFTSSATALGVMIWLAFATDD